MRNDAQDFAQRLYSHVPANYRAYDDEQGLPLLALLQVIAQQTANLRQDLDDLWDNFFIETCEDWAVPYIGQLIGANLLANPVTSSNRLQVRDTIHWRRSKGTPAMLQSLAAEVSGWAMDFAEFFSSIAWAQNLNHIRLNRVVTPNLRDPYTLSLLGRASDPFAHAVDIRPSLDLDQPRIARGGSYLGNTAWGTPGQYQIKNLGFFARRLQVFSVRGATPTAINSQVHTFDPLGRELPLFSESTRDGITRAAFANAPGQYFGADSDLAVNLDGIPLASAPAAQPSFSSSLQPFEFDASGAISLDPSAGMRLLNAPAFQGLGAGFQIRAHWNSGGPLLGTLHTALAARGAAGAFQTQAAGAGSGKLVIEIAAESMPGRFPGAVVAVRAKRIGALRLVDALYIYLPPLFVQPGSPATFLVADDGSTYLPSGFHASSLARAAEGQVYPAAALTASPAPLATPLISRTQDAMIVADPARFDGAPLLIEADLFTGIFQPQGAIATVDQATSQYPELRLSGAVWPAETFAPAKDAWSGNLPEIGTLVLLLLPLSPGFFPACEVILRMRGGESLLVYLPEIQNVPAGGRRVFVAQDGSTWFAPNNIQQQPGLLDGFPLARASAGQVFPIPGTWPVQFRNPIAIDLCAPERAVLLHPGELGIDPERGRFAFAAGDPAIAKTGLSVDYREAFTDRIGALTYDRMLDPDSQPQRFVSQAGDSDLAAADDLDAAPVYRTIPEAIAAAKDGEIIEISDSRTYSHATPIPLTNSAIKNLTIRAAAGQRPCLTVKAAAGAAIRVAAPMAALELNGLLISGGPLRIESKISSLLLAACTFDPRDGNCLVALDMNLNDQANYLLCRCVVGALRAGPGVAQLTAADSIIAANGGISITGVPTGSSPPILSPPLLDGAPSVQLERVTVFGGIRAGVFSASESILNAVAIADDRQSGCIRFTRYETGSVLPRRYRCIPSESQAETCTGPGRCFVPVFNSRRFGSPLYAQLASNCPPEILSASEQASEIGAFTGAFNPIRLQNLRTKLQEFMPVGLVPVIIAES
ncbi:MAG TPA: hypothetical protein VMT86_17590 [Bryobacteraceae bacterium]|nr:hypothetical protein [Bryobacteraceae bacterium]